MERRPDEARGGDLLDQGIEALRGIEVEADALQVVATRSRVLRSLDEGSRRRRRTGAGGMMALILGTGTLSWALATGRLPRLIAAVGLTDSVATEIEPAAEPRRRRPAHARAERPDPETPALVEPPPVVAPPPVVETPAPQITTGTPAVSEVPRAPAPAAPSDGDRATRALYRRAHEQHFRGGDPLAALRAWDAYLAAAPTGRFSVEARYNRALALIRLGRRAEAIEALQPFAHGDVAPAGYRQHEARALLAAIGGGEDESAGGTP